MSLSRFDWIYLSKGRKENLINLERLCSFCSSESTVMILSIVISLFALPTLVLAQEAPQSAGPVSGAMTPFQFIFGTVQFFLLAFFVYYILVIRPMQLKQEGQIKFLRELKKDDEVMLSSGLFGKAVNVQPEYVTVEIASGTKVRVHPEHVLSIPTVLSSSTKEKKN